MPSNPRAKPETSRLLPLLLPVLAALALLPLFSQGCSCGHDISFHLQSWLSAAQQFRHGTLYPAWATAPAFNAGEPRFVFYPPLSWTEGALLTFIAPFAATPALFTWLALSASGLGMYFVARRFATPAAAFLAAAIYMANPYMLFTGLERTAYGELLAAAWIPWLLGAALRDQPNFTEIAWPLALLWLTNAPAAVMGSYTLAIIGAVRLAIKLHRREPIAPLLLNFTAGTALGLALAAFYLVPAAYERRFVQITMALVPGLSVPNNFIFAHTADAAHDFVNHQASHLALALLLTTIIALLFVHFRNSTRSGTTTIALATTTLITAFLLIHISQPIWMHLPELAFLQFPWRWLMVLAATAALTLALAFNRLHELRIALPLATAAVLTLTFSLSHHYLYACETNETPRATAQLYNTSHGTPPTDEYTPGIADNDILRFDSPAYWLTTNPEAFAPQTIPNPNATQPDIDFGTPPPNETVSQPAPHHFTLNTPKPEYLILNLRDYPNWQVTRNQTEHPAHIQRDDGLLAIALPAGSSTIDITWHTGADRELGTAISLLALALFGICIHRSRKIVL
jgi:hypothetical protein